MVFRVSRNCNGMWVKILSYCSPQSRRLLKLILWSFLHIEVEFTFVYRTCHRSSALWNSYWLILLALDIENNPGPMKYPCTTCSKVMRSNQQRFKTFCCRCQNWMHTNCCGISLPEYWRLGEHEDKPWYCYGCTTTEHCSLTHQSGFVVQMLTFTTNTSTGEVPFECLESDTKDGGSESIAFLRPNTPWSWEWDLAGWNCDTWRSTSQDWKSTGGGVVESFHC